MPTRLQLKHWWAYTQTQYPLLLEMLLSSLTLSIQGSGFSWNIWQEKCDVELKLIRIFVYMMAGLQLMASFSLFYLLALQGIPLRPKFHFLLF